MKRPPYYREQLAAVMEVLGGPDKRDELMPLTVPKNLSVAQVVKLKLKAFSMAKPKGRPRADKARERILQLKASGLSWANVAKAMNAENEGASYNRRSCQMLARGK